MTKEETISTTHVHTEGPPWSISAKFSTYDEAQKERVRLLAEENLQVKVHWMRAPGKEYYAVKTRICPSVALADEAERKREEKKRRKAKLNKKRRKK